jgi:glutamate--cysteine ligase
MPSEPASPTCHERRLERLERNHERLVERLASGAHAPTHQDGTRRLGLELERFVYDDSAAGPVGYDGPRGVGRLLEGMRRFYGPDQLVVIDGFLAGFAGDVTVGDETVGITVSLEPAAQLECSVGPSASVAALLGAVEAFDEQVSVAAQDMGCDFSLVPRGYNPWVSSPEDLPLIPKERYALMDAYLSRTGRYARDMMRASASTQVSVDHGDEADALAMYRLAIALGPLLSFLCDNAPVWRGCGADEAPRMVRSRIWEQVDPARCGTVPHTFDEGFGFEAYAAWLENVCPILFTDARGNTTPTPDATEGDIMCGRDLAPAEVTHMLSMVFPDTRWKGFSEIRVADSLPPRLAAGYTALIKGIFYDDVAFAATRDLLAGADETTVARAWKALQEDGWDAAVYGRPMGELTDELVSIARGGLEGPAGLPGETGLLEGIASLWGERRVPRDLD